MPRFQDVGEVVRAFEYGLLSRTEARKELGYIDTPEQQRDGGRCMGPDGQGCCVPHDICVCAQTCTRGCKGCVTCHDTVCGFKEELS